MRVDQWVYLDLLFIIGLVGMCNAGVIRTKVAILGGGMAGTTAARTLSENGISDFLIIEAEPVLGGRMKHINFGGYTIELGANWIAGIRNDKTGKENPIWTVAQKYKLNSTRSNYDDILTYDQNGFVDYMTIVNEASDKRDQVVADATTRIVSNLQDISFEHGFNLRGWIPQTPYEKAADWWTFDFEFGDTPSASSMIESAINTNVTHIRWSDDEYFVYDSRGYGVLVQEESKEFATTKNILYNSIVTEVHYSNDLVKIILKDGEIIEAEYAICTFSIGVLQHNDVKFIPQFPLWKQESIVTFKMTTYTKIFLQFPSKFWNNTQFFLYADPYRRGYYPQWQSLSEVGFLPDSNIIFVTVVTDQAYIVEAQSNDRTLKETMEVLRSMFGKNIPRPINFYYYRWSQDPLFRGSYSNWPVGTSQCQHDNLRRPVGRLHFTGEAYSKEHYGYVHGAYFEGMRTGKKIADYVLNKAFSKNQQDYSCRYQ